MSIIGTVPYCLFYLGISIVSCRSAVCRVPRGGLSGRADAAARRASTSPRRSASKCYSHRPSRDGAKHLSASIASTFGRSRRFSEPFQERYERCRRIWPSCALRSSCLPEIRAAARSSHLPWASRQGGSAGWPAASAAALRASPSPPLGGISPGHAPPLGLLPATAGPSTRPAAAWTWPGASLWSPCAPPRSRGASARAPRWAPARIIHSAPCRSSTRSARDGPCEALGEHRGAEGQEYDG